MNQQTRAAAKETLLLDQSRHHLTRVVPWFVLTIALSITWMLAWNERKDAMQHLHAEFDVRVHNAENLIKQRMDTYQQVLAGVQGLFLASKKVQREEFRAYASMLRLDENYPGIQGVGFMQAVAGVQKSQYIAAVRKEGFPAFTVKPLGERDIYAPVTYLEPFSGRNLRPFGYDNYFDPVRRAALDRARDIDAAAITGKVTLLQEDEDHAQAGFLMVLPVYRNGLPHDTLARRRANFAGWVYAPFRMDDLMQGILGEDSGELDIEVFDGEVSTEQTLMHDADSIRRNINGQSDNAWFKSVQHLRIAGHTWTLGVSSLPLFEAKNNTGNQQLILMSGMAMSALLAMLSWMLVYRRERAMRLAQDMNKELIASEQETQDAHDRLKDTEERWRFALEGSGLGAWDWNVSTGKVNYSTRCKEMIGYAENEIGDSIEEWTRRIHPEDKSRVMEAVTAYLEGRAAGYAIEHRLQCKDGSYIWAMTRGKLISRTEDGQPLRMMGTISDISERKQAEVEIVRAKEAAELSSSELGGYIQAIGQHAIISVGDLGGRIIEANDKFCAISGYSREELLGKNHRIVNSGTHSKAFFAEMWAIISAGKVWRGEICNRARNGVLYWVDSAIVPVKDAQGRVVRYISVRIDITERKKIEAELQHAMVAAETASVAKSAFLANMSHEIRTPMNGVLGMLQLLQLTQLTPEQEGYVNTAYRSGDALLVLLNGVLDYSKMEAGRIELEAIDFDLRTLVEDVMALQASRGRDKGLTIACLIDAALPDRVHGDPTRLRQVLNNLLSNAIKFTEHGEVMVTAAFAEGSEHMLRFSVSDTGIGIPLSQQEAIFKPFTQADSSITRKFGGTGLGLALSRKLVEAMGGKLTLSSRAGEGSIFSFTVSVQAAAQEFMPWQPQRGLAGIRALIVDDNAASRSVLEHYLDHWGMTHDSVQEGQAALRQLHDAANAGRPYDITLLDQQMPGMEGIELARRIQADKKLAGVRMILLSSGAQPGQAASAHAAGVQAYLPKPVRMHELHDTMVRLLDVAAQADQPLVTRHLLAEEQACQSARVLVVEDNAVNQQVVVGMLRKLGIHADVAGDGEQALKALAVHRYGLVLMDMMMPVLDGLETTRRLRATESAGKHTPVIAMTANNNESDRVICMAAGMDDCLYKPFQFEGLRTVVARWLDSGSDHGTTVNGLKKNGLGACDTDQFDREILVQLREVLGQNFHKTIQTFMTDTEQRIAALRAAAVSGDLEGLQHQAHTIKGSSSNLGADELAELCSVLQQQSKTMVIDDIVEAVKEIGQSFERAKRVLEAERG